jgi:CDP-6-deoxy-D-xylo-4-hexulose-3-dehydrase|tara:strand:+ start:425 stop:1771 length:1347 start_codon:yes stop_codon:yes gene_type:complete
MKVKPFIPDTESLRSQILDLTGEYAEEVFEQKREFIPGETHVPVSGKLIGREEIKFAVDACLDGWFTTGRFAEQFEKKFAKYMNQRHCILTNSGSSANLLALSALTSPQLEERRLKPGDEVITVAAGFPTTVNPIIQNGLVPVFVDVSLDDYGIDVEQMEKAWSHKVKAVMLAHTLGNPFNLGKVTEFVKKHNLWFIEDCCDAVGSTYNGKMVGTFGDLATVSFYPAHHITMGEGGAVLTSSPKLKKIVESFRDWGRDCWCATGKANTCGKRFDWQLGDLPHGYDHKYIYSHIGYNFKLTDMQAAIGLAQLKNLDQFIQKRKANFQFLYENLQPLSEYLSLPEPAKNSEPSWFGFPISVKKNSPISRNEIVQDLNSRNIGTRLLFGGNLTKQPFYKGFSSRISGQLDNTDMVMKNVFWLGVQPNLTKIMNKFIVTKLTEIISEKNIYV